VISRLTSLAGSPVPAALRSSLRQSGSGLLVVPTRRISQKDVSKAADVAAEAALRRDFERHGLKFAVPASLKYNDEREPLRCRERERERERKGKKKSIFLRHSRTHKNLTHSTSSALHSRLTHSRRFHFGPAPVGSKHRQLVPLRDGFRSKIAHLSNTSFVAPCATLVGNVEVWDHASVWYGCVIKGDVRLVRIGAYTNIQDKCIIAESTGELDADHDGSTVIGHYVTVGHKCTLRACTIESEVLIGMGSVVEDGAYIEKHAIVGAGSLVAAGTRVPSGELWVGRPAKFVRKLTAEEIESIYTSAVNYRDVAKQHDAAIRGSGGSQTAHWILEEQGHADRIGALEWPAVEPEYGLKKPDM
jgi:carbonic anhydrase/acetyltransferase-like protein (isoleucine patch superfamily)